MKRTRIILSTVLWVGDVLILAGITITGFASHNELKQAGFRLLTTFIPLVIAWIVIGWPSQVFDPEYCLKIRNLWKTAWAVILAMPLAAFLRSLMLNNQPIQPVFVLVLMAIGTAVMLVWRIVFAVVFKEGIES